ncbi:MAG: 4-hydroxyphenylpyruvate dioxygenase [Bryobacter sp.]|nr:4-hydroxyphenylpyruvate dioxygenase [Bryobacter sp.]
MNPKGTNASDSFPLTGIDHVEFYVGNAKQAAHFYRTALGFSLTGYRGPETGAKQTVSYVLEQKKIRFVLTSSLDPASSISEHVRRHGDGVKAIALEVPNARAAWHLAVQRGAEAVGDVETRQDEFGTVVLASIALYGDTVHTFVERNGYCGRFLPGYRPIALPDALAHPVGLAHIDHMVGNVGWHEMNRWVDFYQRVLGFDLYQHFDDKDISTEYSALMSKVVAGGHGRIKFPINEPAEGLRKSQIEEYLDFYQGPGVQHIALATGDIVTAVEAMGAQGIEFLRVPRTYYDELPQRVGEIEEPLEELARLGILVDRDDEGYMLQIFTKPVVDRPTLFFEIIQRRGSRSFGKGNFKALFEAIEREQALRGNL